jgi:hypothetical protein
MTENENRSSGHRSDERNDREQIRRDSIPLSIKEIRRAPGVLTLSPELQRLLWAVPVRNSTLVEWVGDIVQIDSWRAKGGDRLSAELVERAGWVSDVARILIALVPALDRIDLMTKAMVLLQSDPSYPRHGYLRALVEYALRLDLARLDLPGDDTFACNLKATLDKSPASTVHPA